MNPAVVALVGPTASGKTGLAIELAARLGAEIIQADSVQVYRGFDIGSAKPTPAERAAAPHHLLDVAEADESFSAASWARLAAGAIGEIGGRERSLVSGGTGLYLRALFDGLIAAPGGAPEVRSRLQQCETAELRRLLDRANPERSAAILGGDRFRLIRALEIIEVTGRTPTEWAARQSREPAYPVFWLALGPPRERLVERIAERTDTMWARGLLEETQMLLNRGFGGTPPMGSVGYAEAFAHLQGTLTAAEAREKTKLRTRQYAKRQMTWFRKVPGVHWFDPLQTGTVDRMHEAIVEWLG